MDLKLVIFSIIGGLALFIYGMTLLSNGLQMAFGDKMKELLGKIAGNKLQGVAVGAIVTCIIQSSSATTVTLVGLINAGLISLTQAVPIIMGSNIGTTFTSQLIAFKIDELCLPIIAVGLVLWGFSHKARNEKWKYIGITVMGFGILFLGISIMSSHVRDLAKDPRIVELMARMGRTPLMGILASMIFTEIIQSSSATSGLVITMARGGLIDLKTAIAFILGANIGTTITVCIAAFGGGGSLSSKRAALSHVLFNVLGNVAFFPFLDLYARLIAYTSSDISRQVANSHMLFNITVTCLLLPLSGLLVKFVTWIIKGGEIRVEKGTKFLDDNALGTPPIAIGLAEDETINMAKVTLSMIESSKLALFEKSKNDILLLKEYEKVVDDLDNKIEIFLEKISQDALSGRQRSKLAVLIHAISDIERIADHANNIGELSELRMDRKIKFPDEAFQELTTVFQKAEESVKLCINIIKEYDESIIKQIMTLEKDVDELVLKFEDCHMNRLENGVISPEAGPIYLDILRNLERITDHTHNIAYAKRFGF